MQGVELKLHSFFTLELLLFCTFYPFRENNSYSYHCCIAHCGLCSLWVVVWAERNFTVAVLLRFLLVLNNEKKFDFNNFIGCCGLIAPLRIALNVSHCPEETVKMQISSRSLTCALLLPFQVSRKQ
jgi:hypothetical protein